VKVALVVILLIAANALWFWLMAEMRGHGYPVSYVNFLADLKSFHLLIVDTKVAHRRHVLTFALIALYLVVAAIPLVLILF
jgi:hypothetical protein